MNNYEERIQSMINIKSKYIKSLRNNHLYYKSSIQKITASKKSIEKYIYNKLLKNYSETQNFYNIKVINEIITNQRSRIVAEFKDYLIRDDYSEFIWKYYTLKESIDRLIIIFNYYKQTSVVFPNYILLSENKYLYKNIQKKQKLINILEEKEEQNFLNCKKEGYDTDDFFDISSKVFNSKILDSILNESNTSQIKKSLFGVSTENSNYTDNDGDNKLNVLLNNIDKIEENYYNEFIDKKKLKIDKNIVLKNDNNLMEEKNLNKEKIGKLIEVKKIVNDINNNKNIIISRNRHKSIEISKHSKFSKDESKLKNNKIKSKTESIKNIFDNNNYYQKIINLEYNDLEDNNENDKYINKNIIFNNIYKTDLYLNINNNIIIKETKKNLKKKEKKDDKIDNKKVINKIDFNKLKNVNFAKNLINSDKRKNKYIKKNDINYLLLSINNLKKENYRHYQISEGQKEFKKYRNKTEREKEKESYFEIMNNKKVIKQRKNKSNDIIKKYNKIKNKKDTSKTFDINKNTKQKTFNIEAKNKIMINNFKNTLNNLMGIIHKKSNKRNINIKQNNIRNYKNGYSSRYSSTVNNKENKKFIESYNDSIIKTKNKSLKYHKMKKGIENQTTYKNSLTSRSYISNISNISRIVQKNKTITSLNDTKYEKDKQLNEKHKYLIKKKNEKINLNNRKNKRIMSLTSRESNLYDRNKNKFNKTYNINYTSFIKDSSQLFGNKLNTSNFNYILFGRPKSLQIKKENNKKFNYNNKRNLSWPKKLKQKSSEKIKNDINYLLKERIDKLSKSIKYKRNPIYNDFLFSVSKIDSSLVGKVINTNIRKDKKGIIIKENKNIRNKIKRFSSTSSCKNKDTNRKIDYRQIELKKIKYREINNRRRFKNNNNINNKIIKYNISSYTDRISKKNESSLSLINKI